MLPAAKGADNCTFARSIARNELSHRFPHVTDAGTILFVVRGVNDWRIDALSPRTGERRTIVDNATFVQSAADRLVYVSARGEPFMARYDPSALSVQGAPIALTERPDSEGTWALALSRGGTLAYVPFEPPRRLMAVAGRDGSLHTIAAEPKGYLFPRVSPDGRRIAVNIGGEGTGIDVWLFDVERETLTRVTNNRNSFQPVWDSTGTTLTFGSEEEDSWSLRSQVVDSRNASTVVRADREGMNPLAWLPDGRTLLFSSWKATAPAQLPTFLVTVGGPARAVNLPPSGAGRYAQGLSPDGRWLAYVSNESGAWEAYVTAFPGPGTTKQVSRGGGRGIRWAKTSNDLYYLRPPEVQPTEIMKVSIRPDGIPSQPMLALKGSISRECENCSGFAFYDTFPDGSLLVLKDERPPAPKRIEVIVNWSAQRTFDRN